jgi:hypothetical protein
MLFLLNDVVLSLDLCDATPPLEAKRFRALTLGSVLRLGAEMFSQQPLLHREDGERARKLALLIVAKHPDVNAALFVAPRRGCGPEQVVSRLAQVSVDIMGALQARFSQGELTPVTADREVWRRMAA